MTQQDLEFKPFDQVAAAAEWGSALKGKTIRGIRPAHDNGPVPVVNMLFTDDSAVTISVVDGVYFEGCLINTLRKAQPIEDVVIRGDETFGHYEIAVRARTFPLLELRAVNKDNRADEFPFVLTHRPKHGG